MNKISSDILGNIPTIGDIVVFNPPKYKGLMYGTCIGFTTAGCPKVIDLNYESYRVEIDIKNNGFYSVKTGFVVGVKK